LTRYKIALGSERLRQRIILEGCPTRASLTLLPVYAWFIKGLESLPSNEVSIRLALSAWGRIDPFATRSGMAANCAKPPSTVSSVRGESGH
jgi:hypothetical protein